MKVLISALIASAFLIGSFAYADEGKFDSLEGKTQFGMTGGAGYSSYSQFNWSASLTGLYYLTSHFAIGGVGNFDGGSQFYYGVGPAAEYFIPLSERGHLVFQSTIGVRGSDTQTYYVNSSGDKIYQGYLTGKVGYRYFLSDDIALSAMLSQTYYRDLGGANYYGSRNSDLSLQLGFSLFF